MIVIRGVGYRGTYGLAGRRVLSELRRVGNDKTGLERRSQTQYGIHNTGNVVIVFGGGLPVSQLGVFEDNIFGLHHGLPLGYELLIVFVPPEDLS